MAKLTSCPNSPGYFEDEDGNRLPARCKSPTCEYCGPIYKKRLLDDVAYGARVIQLNGRRFRFMTLTTGPDSNQDLMGKYYNRFRAILRKHGYRFDYFKVTEFQENGQRHFHILIDVFVPFNMIQYAWRLATDGTAYWVNIKKAQVRAAAGYMSKYMTKQTVFSTQFKKGERRYSFSRRFPRMPKEESTHRYAFVAKPDHSAFIKKAIEALRPAIEALNAVNRLRDTPT